MSNIGMALNIYRDDRFANLGPRDSQRLLAFLYEKVVSKDPTLRKLNEDNKAIIQSKFMNMMPRSLENYMPNNNTEMALLLDKDELTEKMAEYDPAYSARVSALARLDSKRASDSAIGITGGFSRLMNNLVKRTSEQYNKYNLELEAINPDVEEYARMQVGEEGDYGKQLSAMYNGLAVAGDMMLSHGLYGSIEGGGGLITKGLYNSKRVQNVANMAKSADALTRVLGKGGIVLTEALAEGLGYIGEEAFVEATNTLVTGKDFSMEPLPNAFAKGVAFSTVGNALGALANRFFGGVLKTFTWDGYRPDAPIPEAPLQELRKQFDVPDNVIRGLRANGATDADLEPLFRAQTRANEFLADPKKRIIQDEMTTFVFNQLNDSNLVKQADGFKVDFYKGVEIEPVKVKTLTELNEKLHIVQSAAWEKRAIQSSQYFGDISVSFTRAGGADKIRLNKSAISETFVKEGAVDVNEIKRFFEATGRADVNIIPRDDYFSIRNGKKGKDLYVPTEIKSLSESETFARRLLRSIGTTDYSETMSFIRASGRGLDYNTSNLKKLVGANNVEVLSHGRVKVGDTEFPNVKKAMADAQARLHTEEEIIDELGKKDIYIRSQPDSTIDVKIGQGGNWENYESFADLFEKNSSARLSGNIENSFKLIAPDLKITDTVNIATGGRNSITQRLSKWGNKRSNKFVQNINGDKIYFDTVNKKYEIEYGSSGIKKQMDTLEQAKKEVRKGKMTVDRLEKEAELKGYKFTPTPYGYNLRGNGEIKSFTTQEALESYLGAQEAYKNLAEFIDLPENNLKIIADTTKKQMDEYIKKVKLDEIKIKEGPPPRTSQIGEAIRSFGLQIDDRIRALGDSQASALQQQLSSNHKLFERQFNSLREQTNRIFDRYTALEKDHLQDVLAEELDPALWPDMLRKRGYDGDTLNNMLGTLGEVRQTYDFLGETFGISPDTWIRNYSTRIRETDLTQFNNGVDFDSKVILDPRMEKTKDLDFYARNIREEDFITSKYGNAQTMLELYARAGLRELYLGNAIKNTNAYLDAGEATKEVHKLLSDQIKRVTGRAYNSERLNIAIKRRISNDNMIKRIQESKGRFKNTSPERKAALIQSYRTRDLDYTLSTLMNSSVMAWKMRLPFRNVSQVYTTLGPVFGNEYVWKAQGEIFENAQRLYQEGLEKGILQTRDARTVDHFMAWLSNSNRAGMNHFKNSDDYTRLVAMETIGTRFDDAFRSLSNEEIDFNRFMKYSKADMLNESDKRHFVELIKNGEINNAKTLMQQRGTKWTMFDYDLANKPEGQTTTMGKMFGQFSTYPLGYFSMMKRAFKSVDAVGKLAFASRLALNTYAVYFLYTELLGIQGMPTNPIGTLSLTGGPMVGAMNGIYNAVTNQDASVGNKLMAIGKEGLTFVPFAGIAKKEIQAVQSIIEQDYYNAFIYSIGGSPTE